MPSHHLSPPSLNPQQHTAATHRGTPLLVVAGAGTGKTKTLVSRVVHLIDSGADPGRILLLTFTRRAAAEMIGRVASAVGAMGHSEAAARRLWGGTFHATANRLLRRYGSAAGLPEGFTVLDHGDSIDLFALVRTDEGFGERGRRFPKAETIAAIYSRMVNSQASLADVLATDYPWCHEHIDDLRTLFAAYTAKKRRNHVLDYDDLLLYWRGLTGNPIGEALRCLFDHILIDEYQDTNTIQAEIVAGMCGHTTELCAVGDDAQAIYGFRAATVANMWAFPHTFPGATVVTLEQNYRSTSPILTVANALLDQQGRIDDASYDKRLWSDKPAGITPRLITCYEESEQSTQVADLILEARERGLDLRDQAVLFRAGHHADSLELELVRRDIPYVKYGGLKYLEAAHVKDVLSLLRILENPDDEMAWRRALLTMDGVGPATARRLMGDLRVDKPNSNALIRFIDGIGRVPTSALEQATELRHALSDCAPEGVDLATQLDRLKAFCGTVFPHRYENSEARLADIDQLIATARSYPTRSRFLTELTLDPPERTGDLAGPPHLDDDWLTLSTIHSAKGCEWRAVYVIHAADGNIPSEMALSDEDGLAEELRLLYVATTRAKEELTVTFPLRYHVHRFTHSDRHHFAQLSRFLQPIRDHFEVLSPGTVPPEDDSTVDLTTVGVAEEVDTLLQALWQ
jgi:DNA helicase-2/ATP-dependent DNA helicase PcrA